MCEQDIKPECATCSTKDLTACQYICLKEVK